MHDATTFYDIVSRFAKDYYVPDILLPTSSCIFVLESPHVQEVKHGAPVAGSSGATMSKHLFSSEYAKRPLGLLVAENAHARADEPRLNGIGLINVCNVPLQKSAYGATPPASIADDWFADMEYVRSNNQRVRYQSDRQNEIQDWLTANVRTKLLTFRGRKLTLIPCGRFAQKYVRLAAVQDDQWEVIDDVPHPSYNSWDRPRYQAQIAAVQQAVEQAATPLP
ncbi:hypothetical protein [Alicyclobacillus fastidiosus]|uniref:Uracil-DNA glycosylase-like domain-containing protein n=1 Tax=Alicyclobacillus fastidiosus TaxID=392011 RepID=A0ABV5AHC1_9BACL|nr:hypothetical protein [Alicyclobacillus fastidiosus]WEH09227.1 hypothetical protein PYS47_21555 [Alicyclobacillus fastidiosus]